MKYIKTLPILAAILLQSCAVFQNPILTQTIIAGAVSVALQHIPADKQATVAKDIEIASGLYNALAGPEGIPTPEQFASVLDKYLPADSSKPLATAALNALYSSYYPTLSAKSPKDQLAYLGVILAGFKAGAAPYVK